MSFADSTLYAIDMLPLAATEVASEAVYEFARLESLSNSPWAAPALAGGLLLLLVYVWWMYHREARTVTPVKAGILALLRTVALAGLLAFFLGLEKRSSTQVVEPSRVAVLVDTSLSMDLPAEGPNASNQDSRAASVQTLLAASPLVGDLASEHDVDLVAFGESTHPRTYIPQRIDLPGDVPLPDNNPATEADPLEKTKLALDFQSAGRETRIGDAIATTLERYQGLPLAGIVILTDGGQNRGLEIAAAAEAAAEAKVKIHSLGFGPIDAPANVALRELIAPERAYPGDKLTLQAVLHAQDLAGQPIEVQLSRRSRGEQPSDDQTAAWEAIESQTLTIASDDALETLRFETNPADPGNYVYEVRVLPTPREVLVDDNVQQAEVAVIDRQTKVLLYAGGPTRDYRFLRNQLRRDKSFVVDVLLASGGPGISQDANEILNEFPTTAEQLSKYDAMVAFDPDWSALSAEQVRWLEQWVSRQAGGLVVIPGRVNTPRWGIDSRMRTIRGLYPVRMPNQILDLRADGKANKTPLPVSFTREGSEAEFLWLADSRDDNDETWEAFDGVFSAIEHNGPKPGATVYANLAGSSDDEQGPAYIVGQYYGAGQVLYLGSGELWRLRQLGTEHFDRLWTSLLRNTSQARLLQGSPRGKLLITQDRYELGATVPVRAMMLDQQMEPLVADSVSLDIALPGGRNNRLVLPVDTARAGNFAGEFRVVLPGTYQLSLPVPDSTDQLTRTLHVITPQLEVGQTTRNVEGLQRLAEITGGNYYESVAVALAGNDQTPSITAATPSQSRSKRVLGAIDKLFAKQHAFLLLAIVVGALALEWIIRRLNYLA